MIRILFCFSVIVSGFTASLAAAERPNFVFFFIDDMGWKDVGFMGSEYYQTPHIDALARSGMVFTRAYSCGPNCAPSRACLMSGLYSPRHGIYTVGDPRRGNDKFRKLEPIPNRTQLADRFETMAEALKTAGYATATMGKWHLGPDPRSQGFDLNIAGNRSGSPRGGYFSPYRNPQLSNGPAGEYLTDRLTHEAVRFIERSADKPFFLYLTHYAVHTPIQGKPKLIDLYRDKKGSNGQSNPAYAAMVHSVDQSVGRVLKTLKEKGLTEKTVVVFCSDNGGYGPATSMKPLRGSKGMLYEGGIRMPLTIRWPSHTRPGTRSDSPVIHVDFYPTFLQMAGLKLENRKLDGESLVPLLNGSGKLTRQFLFWHFPAYLQAYRRATGPFRTTPVAAVRKGDWKLLEFFEDGRLELYNTKDDLAERKNLVASQSAIAEELHGAMKAWRKRVGAPVPTVKNPRFDPEAKWTPKRRKRRRKKK